MVLLSPANLILAASIAGPLLVLLYVLKLRRRPVRVGSALFWNASQNDAQANEPFQRPRLSWLFFLHTLILALLALAVGRLAIADARGAANRTIIILDTSASMSAMDLESGASRLSRAKSLASNRIQSLLGEGFFARKRQVSLISSAQLPAIISPFTSSQALILDALERQLGTDQPGDLGAAISLARSLASSNDEANEDGRPSIEVFTDGGGLVPGTAGSYPGVKFSFVSVVESGPATQPTMAENVSGSSSQLQTETSTTPLAATLPPQTVAQSAATSPTKRQEFVFPSAQEWNVGITLLNVQRDPLKPGSLRVFVQITSNSSQPRSVPLAISINGTVLTQRVIEVPSAQSSPATQPSRSTSTIELESIGSGMLVVTLGIQDALTSDNQAGFLLDGVQQPTILLVTSSQGTSSGMSAAEWLLADALAELNIRDLEKITSAQYEERAAANTQRPTEVIVFDRYSPKTLPPVPTLSFGGLPPLPTLALKKNSSLLSDSLPFFWKRNHPVLANTTLDTVLIMEDSSFLISPSNDETPIVVDEIATSRRGPVLVTCTYRGIKHIASAFSLSSTNWPLQSSFPVFLAEAVSFLINQPGNAAGRMFSTSQAAFVRGALTQGEIAVDGPVSFRQSINESVSADKSQVSLGILNQAGIYLVSGPGLLDRAVAVNLLNESESALMLPTSDLVRALSQSSSGISQAASVGQSADRVVRLELWPVLLALASILLLIEWFVYGSSLKP